MTSDSSTMLTNPRAPHSRRPLTALVAIGLAVVAAALTGCSGNNPALGEASRALQDRNTALTQENESLKNLVQQLNGSLSSKDKYINELNSLNNDLRSGKSGLEGTLSDLERRMHAIPFGNLNVAALDSATDQALKNLADQHSDILEYDSARGLLRFKADLTFPSGSDQVGGSAKSTLAQLASILNGPAAGYDCRIVGHTDSQRMSPSTRQKHTTNLRLSCDRSISVRNELVSSGVMASRFECAGRGEFDPRVPNSRNGNTPENRRVEIYLAPIRNKIDVTPAEAGNDAPAAAPAPTRRDTSSDEIMK